MYNAVIEKRKAWKQWKNGGTKEQHKAAKTAGYFAKTEAKTEQWKDRTASINNNSDKNHIFKMAKRLKRDNVDVVSKKCVRTDDGKLTVTADDKLKTWWSHYQILLNVKFPWNAANMSDVALVEGPAIKITPEMVSKAILKMKYGKAAEPSGIITEMIRDDGDGVIVCSTSLFNHMI